MQWVDHRTGFIQLRRFYEGAFFVFLIQRLTHVFYEIGTSAGFGPVFGFLFRHVASS